jgi:hypothetical protein
MLVETCPSYSITIFVAGDPDEARAACAAFCDHVGFCVTVTPTHYAYTNGGEDGVAVGLINYPRFPLDPEDLLQAAESLAWHLVGVLEQRSCAIQTPTETYRYHDFFGLEGIGNFYASKWQHGKRV